MYQIVEKSDLATDRGTGFVAVGDPSIVEFEILPRNESIEPQRQEEDVSELDVAVDVDDIGRRGAGETSPRRGPPAPGSPSVQIG